MEGLMETNTFPRRVRLDLLTPVEKQISDAVYSVEKMESDTRLTEASLLMQKAQNLVSDYIDEQLTKVKI
jgi:hypothetical protein